MSIAKLNMLMILRDGNWHFWWMPDFINQEEHPLMRKNEYFVKKNFFGSKNLQPFFIFVNCEWTMKGVNYKNILSRKITCWRQNILHYICHLNVSWKYIQNWRVGVRSWSESSARAQFLRNIWNEDKCVALQILAWNSTFISLSILSQAFSKDRSFSFIFPSQTSITCFGSTP